MNIWEVFLFCSVGKPSCQVQLVENCSSSSLCYIKLSSWIAVLGQTLSLVTSAAAPLLLCRGFDYGWRGDESESSEAVRSFLGAHWPSQRVLLALFLSGHCAPLVPIPPHTLSHRVILVSQNQALDLILLHRGLEGVEGTSWFSLSGKNVVLEQV